MIIKKNTLTGSYYIYPDYSLPQVSKTLPDFLKKRIEGMEPQEVNGFLIWHLESNKKKGSKK